MTDATIKSPFFVGRLTGMGANSRASASNLTAVSSRIDSEKGKRKRKRKRGHS
jgi:hypothetical protein